MPRLLPAGFVAPCQPSPGQVPPAGAEWLHEIKHDGFRLMVRREAGRVRLFTRNGHDWVARYPAIAAAASALQARSFLIDGEAVIADGRGIASDVHHASGFSEEAVIGKFTVAKVNVFTFLLVQLR